MSLRRIISIVLIFSYNSAFGLTLDQCFHEALSRNEAIPTQAENVYQAEQTIDQAWGSLLPTVNFSSQWEWQERAPSSFNAFYPDYQRLAKFTANQPLIQGFREWEAMAKTKSYLKQQKATKENVDLTLYKNVVQNYYTVLAFEKDLMNLTEELKYLNDRIRELERLRHIGRSQLSDVLQAKSQLTSLGVTTEGIRQQLLAARYNFSLVTGLAQDTALEDDAVHFSPSVDDLKVYLKRIDDRPDIRSSKHAVDEAQNQIDIAKADHLPSVALTYNRYVSRSGPQAAVDWDAYVVLTMPIFAGGVTQSKVRQAASQGRQADLALNLAKRTADQEIRTLFSAVTSDLKQSQLNDENVKFSEATFKENLHSYRLGLVKNLDVLTSLTNFIEAKRSMDKNRFALKSDFLRLKAAAAIN